MKIDIHTHTKKCKSGDAPTREISPTDFCSTILSTEVRIIAITNHNVFDLDQYKKIQASLPPDAQVWPGIELDVLENGSRGHLLVIVSPKLAKKFSEAVDERTKGSTPDSFTATIDQILQTFDSLEPIYVAHYRQKTPNISDDALEKLLSKPYTPSSGEASMVMLQKELETDKEVYILDEPERSLGNEYINEVIVPLIKGLARSGKKVFISTHDANIAVRTLPYSSIYRCHGAGGYKTYIGNPFSGKLVNPEDNKDQLNWKKISMKTLEGGEEAFGERGKIYGSN